MKPDPRTEALRQALAARASAVVQRSAGSSEAAVALIVRPGDALEVLFIERTTRDADPWSGHIAFPGGRRADADPDLLSTALREAEEETGIPVARTGTILGRLDELIPRVQRMPLLVIAPWVIAVPAATTVVPDSREVRSSAWIPLRALRDPRHASELRIERAGALVRFPSIVWRDYVIWGITHRIVTQFLDVASGAGL